MSIRISVIICTLNRVDFLRNAIKSLIDQTLAKEQYEIIVVDNGSKDNTKQVVCDEFAYVPNLRYIYEPILGLSQARNTGWKKAKGKYVVFMDDDAEAISEKYLEFYLKAFEMYPDAAACGGRVIPKSERETPSWATGISTRHTGGYDLGEKIVISNCVIGCNNAWNKPILQSMGGFDTRLGRKGIKSTLGGEESELARQALKSGYEIYYSPDASVYHYQPVKRFSLFYIIRLHYGHGRTGFRYTYLSQQNLSRKTIFPESVSFLQKTNILFLKIMKYIFIEKKDRKNNIIRSILVFMYDIGHLRETFYYSIRGKL